MSKIARRGNRKRIMLAFFLILCCGLWGCSGKKQETAKEDVPDDIYVPKRVVTSVEGGYGLPEGFSNPTVAGGSMYFDRWTAGLSSVSRIPIPEADEAMELEKAQSLFVLSTDDICLDKGEGLSEKEILSVLDRAMEAGENAAAGSEGQEGQEIIEAGNKYASFGLHDYAADQEGNLYLALNYYTGNGFLPEYAGCLACKMTPEGEWAYRSFFPGIVLGEADESLAADGRGGMYLLTAEGILSVDSTGAKTGMVKTEGYKGDTFSSEHLMGDQEGHVYYLLYEDLDMRWRGMEVSREGGFALKEEEGMTGSAMKQPHTVQEGKVYLWDEAVYEYDPVKADTRQLFRWGDSDLLRGCIWAAFPVDDSRFLVWYKESGEDGLYLLTRTPAEELPKKETVVLAALDADLTLQNAVVKFNRQSRQYKVEIEDYGYTYDTAEGALARRDAALVSSQPPDLVSLEGMDLNNAVEKGMLADLLPFLKESKVLDKEDFLENALEGYTILGKLVGIPTQINAQVLVGRSFQAGKLDSWTMEDVYALEEQYPEQTRLVSGAWYGGDGREEEIATRDYLLKRFCSAWYLEEFVDWEGGVCNFDSEGFRKLLEWVGKHGKEEPGTAGTEEHVYVERGYMPEDALFLDSTLDFREAALWKVQFGQETCLLGYPTADGRGKAFLLQPVPPIGLTVKAGNSQGAWTFLEYYISLQCREEDYGLSTSKSHLMEQMEEWIESNRRRKYEEDPFMLHMILAGESVPVYGIPEEVAQKIMDFLEEIDFTPDSGLRDDIVSIVMEEAENYYSGNQGLEEVTGVIQNRVQLMLGESR